MSDNTNDTNLNQIEFEVCAINLINGVTFSANGKLYKSVKSEIANIKFEKRAKLNINMSVYCKERVRV